MDCARHGDSELGRAETFIAEAWQDIRKITGD
jgi:hypothetical protein